MADNPDVAISFETFDYDTYIQTLQTALPAGTEADILQMFGSWVCSYADGGNLAATPEDVLSVARTEDAIFAAQLAGYVCDGTLYGVPQEFNIEYGATLVNTAIAEEAGLGDIAAGWESWDDFIADAKEMTATAGRRHDPGRLPLHGLRRHPGHLLLADPAERRPISERRGLQRQHAGSHGRADADEAFGG